MLTPQELSAALCSIADRLNNSSNPSRSAVASELRRVLFSFDEAPQAQQASPMTRVVVNENWVESDLPDIVSESGGVAVRQGYFGEYGVEMPADQAAQFEADSGEGAYVFNSWEEAASAGGDEGEDYAFEAIDGYPSGLDPSGPSPGAVAEWKTSILQFLSDGEEVNHDSLHEGATDDADLAAAEKALDELKAAGKIRENAGSFHMV